MFLAESISSILNLLFLKSVITSLNNDCFSIDFKYICVIIGNFDLISDLIVK